MILSSPGKHCVYYHRYHLVCAQNGVEILRGVLSSDHVHIFVSVPPKLAISDLMRLMKGSSSHKIQQEFPQIKKRCWGRHF